MKHKALHEPMGREGGRPRSDLDDDRGPCPTWPPKSNCQSREEPQDVSGGWPVGSGVDWLRHPSDLARVTRALVRRVPATSWPTRRRGDLPCDRPLALLQVVRRSWHELVDHPRGP